MNGLKNAQMVLIVLLFIGNGIAADNSNPEIVNANEIFNSMLQTMPQEMKTRVDSASVSQKSQNAQIGSQVNTGTGKVSPAETNRIQDIDLSKLPENVREQVKKTIEELEQQKEERILEFKESSKHK